MSAPALPDRIARRRLCSIAEDALGRTFDAELDWAELIATFGAGGPLTLVFDDVSGFLDARRSWADQVGRAWNDAVRHDEPLRLVLIDSDSRTLEKLRSQGSAFRHPSEALRPELAEPPGHWLSLETGDFGDFARACPDWPAEQVALGFGLLGASDRTLEALDPGLRVSTNVRRLLLAPGGPLFDGPLHTLRSVFQSPARYAGVLRALALGGHEWKDVVGGLEGELPANALAPYVGRLRDFGFLADHRSLDAPVRSRRRRYHLTDPSMAFWWSAVAAERDALLWGRASPDETWSRLRPTLGPYMVRQAPRILRALIRRYGASLLGAAPREVGGLWGDGYDIPTATTLTNGAIAYGDVAWSAADVDSAFARLEDGLRFTRYGYGREARLRIVLARDEPAAEAFRRIRRDPLKRLVTLEQAVAWARAA